MELRDSIHIIPEDDRVKIRFDGDTLGFESTSDGILITNDWNNRHFTLSFDSNSVLYHLTREDIDDSDAGKGDMPYAEFAAEIYLYARSLGDPVSESDLNLDIVGRLDVDKVRSYLKDKGVLSETSDKAHLNKEKLDELHTLLNNDRAETGRIYQNILDPVPLEEAADAESGDNIYIYPKLDTILCLFVYPDCVSLVSARELLSFPVEASGSQLMDHLIRSISKS